MPHAVSVEVLEMEEREDKDLNYIRAALFVERTSQRPILLGEGGLTLKEIGSQLAGTSSICWPTCTWIWCVQVKKHWLRNPGFLSRLGL